MTEEVQAQTETSVAVDAQPSVEPTIQANPTNLLDNSNPVETEVIAEQPNVEVPVETNFTDTLPDEYKNDPSFQSYKDIEGVLKSLKHANSLIGKKIEDMSPEELQSINFKMGVPENKDDYSFDGIDNPDEATLDWFRDTALEAGLNTEQAAKIAAAHGKRIADETAYHQSKMELQAEENISQLKQEFGAAFDERVSLANKALKEFGGQETIDAINNSGLGSDPLLVKLLANAGKMLAEGNLQSVDNSGRFGITPAEARHRIDALKADNNFQQRYHSHDPAIKSEAFKEYERLFKLAKG